MIKIVSGPINSGKSSFMRNDYATRQGADGFVCVKVHTAGQHIGYDLHRLSNGQSMPFIRRTDHRPANWNEAVRIGSMYSFCTEGFTFAAQIADEALAAEASCFFLDEIGPLELGGKGFCQLLTRLINCNIDLVLAVRENLLADVIQYFAIKHPVIVKPSFA